MAPLEAGAFLRSPVLSWRGKARAGLDLVLPRGPATEQSLSSLVRRRFGDELLDRLAQPLAAGIYGADPARLSLDATLPRFVQAERDARSVVVGLRRRQRQLAAVRTGADPSTTAGVRYGMFVSFATGMERLTEVLAATLGPRITTGRAVTAIEPCEQGFRVFDGIGQLEVDGVIVAVPLRVAATLLRPHLPRASALLDGIELGSTATVTVLLDRAAIPHPLDAYGFVVPVVERRTALAATWVSRKWPDRAPAEKELIRVFFGGSARPEVPRWSGDDLVAAARRELRELLGVTAPPALVRVDRWLDAMPQYAIGHRTRAAAVVDAVAGLGPLRLGGTALWGVGIPDAVREGESAAEEIVATLRHRAGLLSTRARATKG
jgi:oxygen-dependent protoporphyrinogen oxidase